MFLNVRLKTHQKRVIYYEKGYIKMKRENINPNNYHLFENEVISTLIPQHYYKIFFLST